ncbi:MFS transporter [Dactylosporangium aurantiacum]|uniref:MFS transporter n=1 Tax=Dactylosporangium aurantiacum TaxID=35754 RepID=UPI000AC7F527|nr:MFS transporter [Dactylosporangium aurantiacum]MDG6109555.1 MFS transporter [Dactylosporangium aurantiacum]
MGAQTAALEVSGSTASAWAPLRSGAFRAVWLMTLAVNIGNWMQAVGAQWLIVGAPQADVLIALQQAAGMLPMLLVAVPAGVMADILDRRRLIIGVQLCTVAICLGLTMMTVDGTVQPGWLLMMQFALGVSVALSVPALGALTPDLVPGSQLTQASALGSISMNVSRAVGPAIAGLLIPRMGPASVFAADGLAVAMFVAVMLRLRLAHRPATRRPERFSTGLRAGARYVRHAPVVQRIMLHALLFLLPASALWALLPVFASRHLHLSVVGYGILLGALGAGAVLGALLQPRLRAALCGRRIALAAGATYVCAMLVLACVRQPVVVAAALIPAGVAWVVALAHVNAEVQNVLPAWVRARGLAVYQVVIFGGQGVGALAWGFCSSQVGTRWTFVAAAGCLAAGVRAAWRRPLHDTTQMSHHPATMWPEHPAVEVEPHPDAGPVLVVCKYQVAKTDEEAFVAAMRDVGRSRQRTGANDWRLSRPLGTAGEFVETYALLSWDEHQRHIHDRNTAWEKSLQDRAASLAAGPPRVERFVAPAADLHRCGAGAAGHAPDLVTAAG